MLGYGSLELIEYGFERLTPVQVSVALRYNSSIRDAILFGNDLEVIQYRFEKTMSLRPWTQHEMGGYEKSKLLQVAHIYGAKDDIMQYLITEYPDDVYSL